MVAYIDPFGAPEYLVDDVSFRQMVGTEYLRFGYHTVEGNQRILRVKLVFPVLKLLTMQADTQVFIGRDRAKALRMVS